MSDKRERIKKTKYRLLLVRKSKEDWGQYHGCLLKSIYSNGTIHFDKERMRR